MVKYLDYSSPSLNYFFDVNKSNLMKKDNRNLINVLGIQQLNTLEDVSLLDIYLSKNNVIEPHYHQNAAELVYCISGAATVSLLNPFTKQIQNYYITPGQVANVPQGWWHYEIANTDSTHLLAIFNAPTPEVILGSDILKLTPSNIMAHTYCMDEKQWQKTVSPVQPSTFIGPTKDCSRNVHRPEPNQQYQYTQQYFPQHMYYY
ncbi:cupin domain-containing protein [Cytobacillus oceanisediminis]|uniref:Cupin n=1 Tax=Cytobacillus oceanisediminis TaxID=665099 RepID=A0ABX3CK89_9BACI|nr:cupin domain-containing protein [Cytobacillus oceanisediminis]OHX41608.1 cupin [Cytobacillus oceanisediminis]